MLNFLTKAAVLLATATSSSSASDVSNDGQRVRRVRAVRGSGGGYGLSTGGGGGGGGLTTDEGPAAAKSVMIEKALQFLQQGHNEGRQRSLQSDGGKGKKGSSSGKGKKSGGGDVDETCTIDVSFSCHVLLLLSIK